MIVQVLSIYLSISTIFVQELSGIDTKIVQQKSLDRVCMFTYRVCPEYVHTPEESDSTDIVDTYFVQDLYMSNICPGFDQLTCWVQTLSLHGPRPEFVQTLARLN